MSRSVGGSRRLIPRQTFLPHNQYDLCIYFGAEELFKKAKNLPASQWSGKWRARLNKYDAGSVLVDDCRAAGIFLKKSVITHKGAG